MPKSTEVESDAIYRIAERIRQRSLLEGRSLLSEREGLWRGEPVEAVDEAFADDGLGTSEPLEAFLDRRLAGASDDVILLVAELLYVHLLALSPTTLDGATKRDRIEDVLGRMEEPVDIPASLAEALDGGLAPTGSEVEALLPWRLRYLAEFLHKWDGCDQRVRTSLLDHAWAFREFAFSLDTPKSQAQRHALVHLVAPETFEPIISESAKQNIVRAFSQFVEDPRANVDQQLIRVRAGLASDLGEEFESFYQDTVRWQWQSDDWETLLEFADLLQESEPFERRRHQHLESADRMAAAREAFLDDDAAWRDRLTEAFAPPNPLAGGELEEEFGRWLEASPEAVESALARLWAVGPSAYERLGGFFQFVPDEVGTGPKTRLALASTLLSGVDAGPYPTYDYTRFRDAMALVDYPDPTYGDSVAVYRHALGFLDALVEDLAGRGTVCRDRLDAALVVEMLASVHPADLDFLDAGMRRRFATFVGRPLTRRRDVWLLPAGAEDDELEDRLAEAVESSEEIPWSVADHGDALALGDIALIWREGDEAGVVAVGDVQSDSQPADGDPVVMLRPTALLDEPLTRETLKHDPVLRRLRIAGGPSAGPAHIRSRDWRRLLAYRPDLADHLPIDATADEVALAPFFRRFFNDRREAERFYGVLEEVVSKMDARGRGDERFAMQIEGQSGELLSLYFADRKMVAIRAADYDGPRILLTLDRRVADELGLDAIGDGTGEAESSETAFYEVPVRKERTHGAQIGRAFDRGMQATLRDFASDARSPHRVDSHHLEHAFGAIFDRDQRRRLFLEGVPEPEAADTADTGPAADLLVTEERFREMLDLVQRRKNVLLQGPPGVGKSLVARRLAEAVVLQHHDERIERIQFHSKYTYADFVQGYRPTGDGGTERRDGIFYQFCRRAERDPHHDYAFVIEEFHRGDPSAVFGELVTLLDPANRGPDEALVLQHSRSVDETFHVPANVHLLGTVNTAGGAAAVDDYPLRRRFAFVDLEPGYGRDAFTAHLHERGVPEQLCRHIDEQMASLNDTIAAATPALGPGYRIGHSYFCPPADDKTYGADWFREIVRHDLAPLLRRYWRDEPETAQDAIDALLELP